MQWHLLMKPTHRCTQLSHCIFLRWLSNVALLFCWHLVQCFLLSQLIELEENHESAQDLVACACSWPAWLTQNVRSEKWMYLEKSFMVKLAVFLKCPSPPWPSRQEVSVLWYILWSCQDLHSSARCLVWRPNFIGRGLCLFLEITGSFSTGGPSFCVCCREHLTRVTAALSCGCAYM